MAIYVDRKKLAPYERAAIQKIIKERLQPLCPGCGKEMDLSISDRGFGDGYSGNYMCNSCRSWMTQTVTNKDIVLCASQAYNRAIAVTNEMHEVQNARRRLKRA